jgi:hypothetical protein
MISTGRYPIGIIGFGAESSLDFMRRPRPPQKALPSWFFPRMNQRLQCGQWHHQSPTPLANIAKLLRDLVLEVPRKNQHIIRLFLGEPLDRMDRDMRSG